MWVGLPVVGSVSFVDSCNDEDFGIPLHVVEPVASYSDSKGALLSNDTYCAMRHRVGLEVRNLVEDSALLIIGNAFEELL